MILTTKPCGSSYINQLVTKIYQIYLYNMHIANNNVPTSKSKWISIYANNVMDWKIIYSFVFNSTMDTHTHTHTHIYIYLHAHIQ